MPRYALGCLLAFTFVAQGCVARRLFGQELSGGLPVKKASQPRICRRMQKQVRRELVARPSNASSDSYFSSLPSTWNDLMELNRSLVGGCAGIKAGRESRSGAEFAATADSRFVLKNIRQAEAVVLQNFAGMNTEDDWLLDVLGNDMRPTACNAELAAWMSDAARRGRDFWYKIRCRELNMECNFDCVALEDPQWRYRNVIQRGSFIVPALSLHVGERIIAMPNFTRATLALAARLFLDAAVDVQVFDVKQIHVPYSPHRSGLLEFLLATRWEPRQDANLTCGGPCGSDRPGLLAGASTGPGIPALSGGCFGGEMCYQHAHRTVTGDVKFLADFLPNRIVDYSLVFVVATPRNTTGVRVLPGENASELLPASCVMSGAAGAPRLLCIYVIDYLKERGALQRLESYFRGNMYNRYAWRTRDLLRCSFQLTRPGCEEYLSQACAEWSSTASADVGPLEHPWCTNATAARGDAADMGFSY